MTHLHKALSEPNRLLKFTGASLDPKVIANIPLSDELTAEAFEVKQKKYGNTISYSPKVFLPITFLCRDVCHYCTFAKTPKKIGSPYLIRDEILRISRMGEDQGCREALFTLGEKPEKRYKTAREFLYQQGFDNTVDYVLQQASSVFHETKLIPHINAGNLTIEELLKFKKFSGSVGLMLESSSNRLSEKGMPHYGSPDKLPSARIETLINAGLAKTPFTTGVLIGIGETREEFIETIIKIASIHQTYDHIQEVIIQNFVPKSDTLMHDHPAASDDYLLWAIAIARLILPLDISIQAPPNLNNDILIKLISSGINDFGGISPVTIDHVNPESPWPNLQKLEKLCRNFNTHLIPRTTVYPKYLTREYSSFLSKEVRAKLLKLIEGDGYIKADDWRAGESNAIPLFHSPRHGLANIKESLKKLQLNPTVNNVAALFQARDNEVKFLGDAANEIRQSLHGNEITFAVNRNINYTNICKYSCNFCAFSKGRGHDDLRGMPYDINHAEIQRRVIEAEERGATEVCLQGGIHPRYTGDTYLQILDAIREVSQNVHIHAFSPLEILQGSETLNISLEEYLKLLKSKGLNSIPGTAAEILNDSVRDIICPDKLNSAEWRRVISKAHSLGIPSTATIMFGHVEDYNDVAIHLIELLDIQSENGGFTEFVPLPFVSQEAPIYRRGLARSGPSFREVLLMHSIARLLFKESLPNIQGSWVKAGLEGLIELTNHGINDIGGVLMNESITRAAGSIHGQELDIAFIQQRLAEKNLQLVQRNTLYNKLTTDFSMLRKKLNIPLLDISYSFDRAH